MDITNVLEKWKDESLFGERDFQEKSYSHVEGEKLYLISIKCKVSVDGESRIIKKTKHFQTNVQNELIDDERNPKTDEYIFNHLAEQLENVFFKEFNAFVDGEMRK